MRRCHNLHRWAAQCRIEDETCIDDAIINENQALFDELSKTD